MIKDLQGTNEEKLRQLGMTTLSERRKRGDAIQCYRIMKGIDDVEARNWFQEVTDVHNRCTRGSRNQNLYKAKARLDLRSNFFSLRACDAWNQIPLYIKNSANLNIFKNNYDEWMSIN